MGLGALREKQLVRWNDRILRLDGRLADGMWHMTEVGTGLMDKQAENDVWLALERGELAFVTDSSDRPEKKTQDLLARLSVAASPGKKASADVDVDGANAVKRLKYVEALNGQSKAQSQTIISRVWSELRWPEACPAYSTVTSWRRRSNATADRVSGLRDNHSRKGRRGPRYPTDVMDLLRDVRDERYLCRSPRITIKRAATIAGDRIRLINADLPPSQRLPIPKRKAMESVIREVDAVEVIAARFGADVALRMMRTSLGGVATKRPLERVEMDHTKLSVILLDDDFYPLGRASFTGAKDAHVRAAVGYYWGAEVPSIVSLARCIRHSVMPKLEFLKKYPDVRHAWDCFGVAESWVLDNGFEEHASALRQAASQMGVQKVEFCARAAPWEKPNIERFIRQNAQGLLNDLPGATMENILARTDFDPKVDILIRASTFDQLMAKWVVDVYMQTPLHVLRNRSPAQAWANAKGTFTVFVPTEIDLLERLFLRQEANRLLDHAGVEYDRLDYNSLDMKLIREKLGPKLRVDIRVSDEELGYIYVGVPGYDVWVKVPCLDQEYASGLTRWQHTKCKLAQRAFRDEGQEPRRPPQTAPPVAGSKCSTAEAMGRRVSTRSPCSWQSALRLP